MTAIPAELPEAMKLHAAGRVEEAESFYRKLLAANPDHPEILHLLGTACFQRQAFGEAAELLERAVRKDRKNAKHYLRLVEIYKAASQPEKAIDTLVALLAVDSGNVKAAESLLNLCLNNYRFEPAIVQLNRMIAQHPEDITLRNLILLTFNEAQRFEESLPHYAYVLQRNPVQEEAFYKSYGRALHRAGQLDKAVAFAEQAIARFPTDTEMYILQAANHTALGQHDQTLEYYRRGLATDTERASLHQSIGLIQFLQSGMRDGYDEYLWRHKLEKAMPLAFSLPEWQGERLDGKRLILWAEQGVGDIVMFLSLLPWALAQGGHITLAVYPKLQPLLKRSFPEVEVVDLDLTMVRGAEERWDLHQAMGELMRFALPHYTPAEHPPFLKADADKAGALRERYLALQPGTEKLIGISWFTSNGDTGYLRSIPLEQWQPLFDSPGIQWVSLQYGDHAKEIAAINKKNAHRLYHDPDIHPYDDTDALAAQIKAMDQVLTIQNATAHLAGALGVPTTLMLSAASDWRWGLERTDSLWYGSVNVLRQKEALKWKPVIREAKEILNG